MRKSFLFYCILLAVSQHAIANNVRTIFGVIISRSAYFTESNFKSIVSNGYTFEPLEIVNILNNGELEKETFVAIQFPIDKSTVYLNKGSVFYDESISDLSALLVLAKKQIYKDQIDLWDINSEIEILMDDKIIVSHLIASKLLAYSNIEQVPDHKNYIKKTTFNNSKYYLDVHYTYKDKEILVHEFDEKKIIGKYTILSGDYSDDIRIGMKRSEFNSFLGVPNDYTSLFSEISWTQGVVEYQWDGYSILFNFVKSDDYVSDPDFDFEDGLDFTLESIEIENYFSYEEMP